MLATVELLVELLPPVELLEVAVLPLDEFVLVDELVCSRELFVLRLLAVELLPSAVVDAVSLLLLVVPTPLVELELSSELALLLDDELLELDEELLELDDELVEPCR